MSADRAEDADRPLNLEQEVHIECDSTMIPRVTRTGEALTRLPDGKRPRRPLPQRELLAEKFDDFTE